MNKKIIGILICILFFGASVVPTITGHIINIENNQKVNRTTKNLEGLDILSDATKPTWDIGQTWWYKVNTLNFNQLGVSLNANPFYLMFEVKILTYT